MPIEEEEQGSKPPSAPPWALAAGTQLNLVGDVADETVEHTEKPRLNRLQPPHRNHYPVCQQHQLHLHCHEERDLHRHAGCGGAFLPPEESRLGGVENDLPAMEPLSQFADSTS